MVEDYKTALGMLGDARLGREPQVVTYAAAIGLLTGASRVRVTLWSLRYKQGQRIELSADEWLARALPIWQSCVEEDALDAIALEQEISPHPTRCGTCEFAAECGPPPNMATDDAALWRAVERSAANTANLRNHLNTRLRERTSHVSLPDGTVLGPHRVPVTAWVKGWRADGLRLAADALAAAGLNPFDYLEQKASSLREWVADLPQEVRLAIADKTEQRTRQTYLSRSRQDVLTDLEESTPDAEDELGTEIVQP